jgi:hypothetical protein
MPHGGCGWSSTPCGPPWRRRPPMPYSWLSACNERRPQQRWRPDRSRATLTRRGPWRQGAEVQEQLASISGLTASYHSCLQSHGIDPLSFTDEDDEEWYEDVGAEDVEQIHMAALETFVSLFQLRHRLHFDSFVCLFLSVSLFLFA